MERSLDQGNCQIGAGEVIEAWDKSNECPGHTEEKGGP